MRTSRIKYRTMRITSTSLVVAALTGCTVGPRYHAPAPPTVSTYTPAPQPIYTTSAPGNAGGTQRLNSGADVPAQWWTLFQSPALDRMVREALDHSPTLVGATARLKEAQEEANARTGATKYPSVSGSVSIEGEQVNLAAFGIPEALNMPIQNPPPFALLNGSVAVSYALDFFGVNRRLIEGLNAQVAYENWQLKGARLMLAGNVVSSAIRQAQLRSQIEITQRMLSLRDQILHITEQRYQAGGVSEYDVRSQRTALAQVRASLPPLEEQLDLVNHQLAALMGKTPSEARVEEISLDRLRLPADLPISLPSSLLRQRPDICAAEALLQQASANVGVASANLYPQIVLSGSGGGIGTSFSNGGPVWNVGASLAQPIFNGGSLRAEKRKAIAAYEEAGSAYQQTVLQAFREVADALRVIEHDAQTLEARSDAASQAESAYEIASKRYAAGGISQLSLLDAQRQQLETALDRVTVEAARYSNSATLFQALGGGWWNERQGSGQKLLPDSQ
jgi:NodT family efflux transporter outer membrane factor (OMF) lipoprotein